MHRKPCKGFCLTSCEKHLQSLHAKEILFKEIIDQIVRDTAILWTYSILQEDNVQ